MKYPRLFSTFFIAAFLAATVPLTAEADAAGNMSPLTAYMDEKQINPDFLEWLENDSEGFAPPAQDFSYLNDSYAALAATAPAVTNRGALPESYDLRDYHMRRKTPGFIRGDIRR